MPASFHRRQLLHLSGLGIASLGLAPWIEQAFAAAQKPRPPSPRARALTEAWTEARMRGKPMLVLVVPAFRDQHDRGRILAAFLLGATPDTHAELAICAVTCAMMSELRALLPEAGKELKGEPMAVLVEPDGQRARVVVDWIPALPTANPFAPTTPAHSEQKIRWVELVSQGFHDAIAGDRSTLLRRAKESLERLPPAERDRLTGLESGSGSGSWSAPDIARCPASALLAARRDEARSSHIAELSRLSRSVLIDKSPPGVRWAENFGGCGGLRLEDPPEEVSSPGPCGTGFLPAESRRFLWLFTKSDP